MNGIGTRRLIWVVAPAALALAACGGTAASQQRAATHAATIPNPAPHIDPYRAGLAYAQCMRTHGVPHPDPDRNGDFHLTPAQDRAMHAATPKQHEAADKACFHLLKGTVSTAPLSKAAQRAALVPLRELKACLRGKGIDVGTPIVKPMPRGRAMFGFGRAGPPPATAQGRARQQSAQHACERKVRLAARIDAIIKADRGEGN